MRTETQRGAHTWERREEGEKQGKNGTNSDKKQAERERYERQALVLAETRNVAWAAPF